MLQGIQRWLGMHLESCCRVLLQYLGGHHKGRRWHWAGEHTVLVLLLMECCMIGFWLLLLLLLWHGMEANGGPVLRAPRWVMLQQGESTLETAMGR